DEAEAIGMRTTMHHAQQLVAYANVLQTSARGLDSMEHWYGLPEAMFTDRRLQRWPAEFNNTDEQMRFAEAGRLWEQAAEPGSPRWNEVMETLLERGFGLSPTFTAYRTAAARPGGRGQPTRMGGCAARGRGGGGTRRRAGARRAERRGGSPSPSAAPASARPPPPTGQPRPDAHDQRHLARAVHDAGAVG